MNAETYVLIALLAINLTLGLKWLVSFAADAYIATHRRPERKENRS